MSSLSQGRLTALIALSNHPTHTTMCKKIINNIDDRELHDVIQEALKGADRGSLKAALITLLSITKQSEGQANATSGGEASASLGLSVTPNSTPGPTRQVATNKRGADDNELSPRKRSQTAEDSSDAVEDGNVIGNDYAERYNDDAKGYNDGQRRINWGGEAEHLVLSAAKEDTCSLSSTSTVRGELTYGGDELVKAETFDS